MPKQPPVPQPPAHEGIAGVRRRLAQVLMATRDPDPPGAYAALAEDPKIIKLIARWPSDHPERLWAEIVERVLELVEAQRCLRCGTCCRKASPTLYLDDLPAIEAGHIRRTSLFTLRRGERLRSARLREMVILERDLLKLRERPAGGCLLLEDHLCRDYDHRPLQCRHLECWSGQHAGDLDDRPRLDRRHLYQDDETALALIDEYEIKLPAERLINALDAALEGDPRAAREALAFIELDHKLRAGIEERFGYEGNELELLLGRDAVEVVRSHGLIIQLDENAEPIFSRRGSA